MAKNPLVLVANPGSASRKYALYHGDDCLITIHFEYVEGSIVYGCGQDDPLPANLSHLTFATSKVFGILQEKGLLKTKGQIKAIALRVVAPSSYFQEDRLLDKEALQQLTKLEHRAPLHIGASLQEAAMLKSAFHKAKLVAISDSAFHRAMPDYSRNYGLPGKDADSLDIRRFGYHGLSVEAVVDALKTADKLPAKLIVCHLGGGASVTAVRSGQSLDTTMGYSPLEGLMMATRSGDLDVTAALVLQDYLKLSDKKLQEYLNCQSGLLGASGISSDIRVLLDQEERGNAKAALALDMYVYRIRQAIGQMAATLGGVDALVFTGTVGERSAEIRKRVIKDMTFLGLELDSKLNRHLTAPTKLTQVSHGYNPTRIFVAPTNEDQIIAAHTGNI